MKLRMMSADCGMRNELRNRVWIAFASFMLIPSAFAQPQQPSPAATSAPKLVREANELLLGDKPAEALRTYGEGRRVLAEELKVNRNTVAKAYTELEGQGVIETIAGRGCFLKENHTPFRKDVRLKMVAEEIDAAVQTLTLTNTAAQTNVLPLNILQFIG